MGRANKKETLVQTATKLFTQNGFVATGVNQITQEANIASMTLYNNFKNKNDLILAVLEQLSRTLLSDLKEELASLQNDPKRRILSVFDYIDQRIENEFKENDDFFGCTFLKASLEFGSLKHPVHKSAVHHKNSFTEIFQESLETLKVEDPLEIALSLQLLIEGALSQAQLFSDRQSVKRAKTIAQKILES